MYDECELDPPLIRRWILVRKVGCIWEAIRHKNCWIFYHLSYHPTNHHIFVFQSKPPIFLPLQLPIHCFLFLLPIQTVCYSNSTINIHSLSLIIILLSNPRLLSQNVYILVRDTFHHACTIHVSKSCWWPLHIIYIYIYIRMIF